MASLYVVSKPDPFAEQLAGQLGAQYEPMSTYKTYPSGHESKQVFSDPDMLKQRPVLFVNRGRTPFDSNMVFTETNVVTGKLHDEYKSMVWTFLPGFPYAREDKGFERGCVVARRRIIEDLQRYCEMLFAVGEHGSRREDYVRENFFNFSPVPSVVEFVRGLSLKDAVALAPDGTANDDVLEIAGALGTASDVFYKRRDTATGAVTVNGTLPDLQGRDLLIYDDMIGMGGTLEKAVTRGKESGAGKIVAVVGLDMSGVDGKGRVAYQAIQDMGVEIYATDAVDSPIARISIVPHVAEQLRTRFLRRLARQNP